MARGRLIARTLGSSRKFAELARLAGNLGEFAQALYPLLVSHGDDFGRLSGDAFTVKFAVFPTSARTEDDFECALVAMMRAGLILRYPNGGAELVIQVTQWDRHQSGLHKRTTSRFPDPPDRVEIPGTSGNPPECPPQEKRREQKGTEGKGREEKAPPAPDDGFAVFWATYPKKAAKRDAEKAWKALAPSSALAATILAAVQARALTSEWRKDGGTFVPHAATYLRGRRWEDETGTGPPQSTGHWYDACPHTPTCERLSDCRLKQAQEDAA